MTSHFDYGLDLLQSKWTGEHRSPNKLAKIVVLALRFIASKKEYDKYFYHEYNPERNTHIYRWRIELPGKMFNGPVGIFWADGEIWEQYSASIWINQRGLQSIFPDGTGTRRGPGGTLLYKKWTNPTTHRYLKEGSKFDNRISERNYFTYNSKHHALDMLHINLLPCLQILISIPELFTAHIENCKDIPEGFNRDVAMSPVHTWEERHGVQGTNSTRCKTKMHLHSTQISIHLYILYLFQSQQRDNTRDNSKVSFHHITHHYIFPILIFPTFLSIHSHFQYSSLQQFPQNSLKKTSHVYKNYQNSQKKDQETQRNLQVTIWKWLIKYLIFVIDQFFNAFTISSLFTGHSGNETSLNLPPPIAGFGGTPGGEGHQGQASSGGNQWP